jgi:hypothetical protein
MASVYLREHIDRPLADGQLPGDVVDAFLVDRNNGVYFESPELKEVSHLLVRSADGPTDTSRAWAQRLANEVEWRDVHQLADLEAVGRRYGREAMADGVQLRVEQHLLIAAPEVDTRGTAALLVVPEFAVAVAALTEVGQVSPPIESEFGTHFILLEQIHPAHESSAEEARALAVHELSQRRRVEAVGRLLEEISAGSEIVRYDDNIDLLRQDEEAILRAQSGQMRESLGGE